MNEIQDIEELQVAADYRQLRSKLKWGGITSIIFGVIAVGMGFALMAESPVNLILAIIGFFLLAEGIWILRTPNPRGMIMEGIAMCTIGVWNVVVTIANAAAGATGGTWAAVLGIFQIYWGIKSFKQYGRFSYLLSQKPSEQSLQQAEDIINSIKKAKPKESENVIELQMGKKPWRGELTGDVATFVNLADNDVIFARRNEVNLMSSGEVTPGKPRKISCRICEKVLDGKISPESMERYEAWKAA